MVRVSVVVPARNEEPRIGGCLGALLAQDYPREAYEVIMVDDGSTDRTVGVAEGFGVTVLRQPHRGGAAARNLGVAHARGELVAFTDADCVAERHWLHELVAAFEDPEVGVCGGDVLGVGDSWIARYLEEEVRLFRLDRLQQVRPWPVFVTANVAYRREVFQRLGLFVPELRGSSDLEMAWRVARDGRCRLLGRPTAVVCHAHPRTVRDLYAQWFGYGAGRAQVDLLLFGRGAAARGCLTHGARALGTVGLAPFRVAARLVRAEKRGRFANPVLDVVRGLAYAAGYWAGFAGRSVRGSWRARVGEDSKSVAALLESDAGSSR